LFPGDLFNSPFVRVKAAGFLLEPFLFGFCLTDLLLQLCFLTFQLESVDESAAAEKRKACKHHGNSNHRDTALVATEPAGDFSGFEPFFACRMTRPLSFNVRENGESSNLERACADAGPGCDAYAESLYELKVQSWFN
jgi:hypothetical protein